MNYFLCFLFSFLCSINFLVAQTMHSTVTKSKFSVQLDENTIVRNAEGKRLPYEQVVQMISTRAYTLDAVRDSNGKIAEYKIRAKTNDDAGTRETSVSKTAHEVPAPTNRGETFPDFILYDINGKVIRSSDLKGKILVFNFWFSTCRPCLNEMQGLNTLAEKYKGRMDVVFLAAGWETKTVVAQFLQTKKFNYTVCPESINLINALKIKSYPTNIVVGKDGKIVADYIGGLPGIEQTLEADIEKLLKQ
ncbi:MAG: TlpA disulfide reductase family protein [Bacteroidetes bacterium]|nr:TlpA disulfide reductase family protein [Bacteroidota bacterium]